MKDKVSFTLDKAVIAAVRKFAQEDDRPISISNAIDMLLKEALKARGITVGDGSDEPKRKRAPKP
jgi:hypothetical protein